MKHDYQIFRSLDIIKSCTVTMELLLNDTKGEHAHYAYTLTIYRDLLASMNQEIFNDKSPSKFLNPFTHRNT
jgi:hypothetical protein